MYAEQGAMSLGMSPNINKTSRATEVATGFQNYTEEKVQYPLLEDNLNVFSKNLSYLEELVNRLESIGHSLHDTNVPKDSKGEQSPIAGVGKLFQMQGMNLKFLNLNDRFETQIQKLNTLI